ncbi:MAG: HAD family hydrolase [Limisphaerales bacterium]|jgi:phosphoglycolate phosphatase-like HAD superfamily hydrolase|nr:HAD hydrolase-like protein [Verrucomicrobiota bacterium]
MMAGVEILSKFKPHPDATEILFDLDGTISLVRAGWSEVMLASFLRKMPLQAGESEEELRALLLDDMLRQNGKPSIFQFIRFAERLQERTGEVLDPELETQEFIRSLEEVSRRRHEAVKAGSRSLESVLVPGVLPMLELLKNCGFNLYLASGTDEAIVLPEVKEFGLDRYFGEHIYAHRPGFSKAKVIEMILSRPGMNGQRLIAFGDGFVEMHETARAGGLSIGVASDESWVDTPPYRGSGLIDPLKKKLLEEAGAQLMIADYAEPERLLQLILGNKEDV